MDLTTKREIASFSYPNEVNCLVFSPDGKTLAVGEGVPFEPKNPGVVHLIDIDYRAPRLPQYRRPKERSTRWSFLAMAANSALGALMVPSFGGK